MSAAPSSREYLGKGIGFPLRVNARGELALVEGENDIEEAIRIVLGTRPGERVMRPEFGCRANEMLFEPRDASTETLIRQLRGRSTQAVGAQNRDTVGGRLFGQRTRWCDFCGDQLHSQGHPRRTQHCLSFLPDWRRGGVEVPL